MHNRKHDPFLRPTPAATGATPHEPSPEPPRHGPASNTSLFIFPFERTTERDRFQNAALIRIAIRVSYFCEPSTFAFLFGGEKNAFVGKFPRANIVTNVT